MLEYEQKSLVEENYNHNSRLDAFCNIRVATIFGYVFTVFFGFLNDLRT